MGQFITQYWLEVIFGLVVTLFSLGYRRLSVRFKGYRDGQSAVRRGLQALLRDRIIQDYNRYMAKGFIPIYALDNVHAMYCEYHELGANGTIDKLLEELDQLPSVEIPPQ